MFHGLASTVIVLVATLGATSLRARRELDAVEAEPETVQIGLFYSGRAVHVRARVPAADAVVIRLVGAREALTLKRKGKKYGLLWMNVGEVHYEAIPTLYLVKSTRKLDEITGAATLRRLGIGFDALRDQIPADADEGARALFGELVKLKERDGLFSCVPSGVQLTPSASGAQKASTAFFLPATAPVGDYTIDVFAFRRGEPTQVGSATIHLVRGPTVSLLTSLATEHGLLYGCLAVAVAVAAGLVIGFVFGLRKGEAH